jgi:hypothetical protein
MLSLQARLHARNGQFAEARKLVSRADAVLPPTPSPIDPAGVLEDRAEVDRLAGNPGQAAASLHAALRIYEDLRATSLAARVRSALTDLSQ